VDYFGTPRRALVGANFLDTKDHTGAVGVVLSGDFVRAWADEAVGTFRRQAGW